MISQIRSTILPCLMLGLSALILGGCLDLLARALIDPSGLAHEAGAALAAQTASNLVGPGDAQALIEIDQTIERLDRLIAEGQDAASDGDLAALRDHLKKNAELSEDSGVFDDGRIPDSIQGVRPHHAYDGSRRIGEPGSDPAHIALHSYRQRMPRQLKTARKSQLRFQPDQEPELSRHQHNATQRIPSSLQGPLSSQAGIDLETGLLRHGMHSGQRLQELNRQKKEGILGSR